MARARRGSKHARPHRPLSAGLGAAREDSPGASWVVRSIPGHATTKSYTCPGCHRPITPGTAHLVVWPTEAAYGLETGVAARRHWHTPCWRRR